MAFPPCRLPPSVLELGNGDHTAMLLPLPATQTAVYREQGCSLHKTAWGRDSEGGIPAHALVPQPGPGFSGEMGAPFVWGRGPLSQFKPGCPAASPDLKQTGELCVHADWRHFVQN